MPDSDSAVVDVNGVGPSPTNVPTTTRPAASVHNDEVNHRCCGDFWKRFAEQRLRGKKPLWRVNQIVAFYAIVGLPMLGVGIAMVVATANVVEYSVRYDDLETGMFRNMSRGQKYDLLASQDDNATYPISFKLPINDDLKPPIYVYYQISKFYQNYKRYVRSIDFKQLHGNDVDGSSLSVCEPQRYLGGNTSKLINPCGLIAWSNFNDTFMFALNKSSGENQQLPLQETGISWTSDRDSLYGDYKASNYNDDAPLRGGNTTTLPIDQSEHLMVWLRVAARPQVKKLYAIINEELHAGDMLTVTVNNRYNTYKFDGAKSVVIATKSWVGGKNLVLPIVWVVVGTLYIMTAIGFKVADFFQDRWDDPLSQLSWVQQRHSGRGPRHQRAGRTLPTRTQPDQLPT